MQNYPKKPKKTYVRLTQEETQIELKRLKKIEKRYNEQLEEIEILKKFQAFLKENE